MTAWEIKMTTIRIFIQNRPLFSLSIAHSIRFYRRWNKCRLRTDSTLIVYLTSITYPLSIWNKWFAQIWISVLDKTVSSFNVAWDRKVQGNKLVRKIWHRKFLFASACLHVFERVLDCSLSWHLKCGSIREYLTGIYPQNIFSREWFAGIKRRVLNLENISAK